MKLTPIICTSLVLGAGTLVFTPRALADEFGANTPYYEDDAWYDFSEWLDGNDYNPTDETLERWDDEVYDWTADDGRDIDNDGSYGYTAASTDDDWFYDYYDAGSYSYYPYDAGVNSYVARYYDFDNDGLYDGYSTYTDWNGDGTYEDFSYYSFNTAAKPQSRDASMPSTSKEQSITGSIANVKQVQVRGAKHTVVSVQQDGTTVNIDLGKTSGVQGLDLNAGTNITVKGPLAKVGDKAIVMAKSVDVGGQQHQINRDRREFTGQVTATHKTKVRGTEHLLAMVEVTDGNSGKMAVDLGPADKLQTTVRDGTELTFTGVPIKVKDKQLVIAHTVKQNGQSVQIQRQTKTQASAGAGATTQPAGR